MNEIDSKIKCEPIDTDLNVKVLMFLLGSSKKASSRVRGFWIADELKKFGAKCYIIFGEERISYIRCLLRLPFYDLIYIQKRCSRYDYYLLKLSRLFGKKAIYDIDDDYSKVKSKITLKNVCRIMSSATAVTVGSENLLKFASKYQQKVYYLPTSVKMENYIVPKNKQKNNTVRLGWIGNGRGYSKDLIEILKEPLSAIANRYKVSLSLVGVCGQKDLYEAFSNIPGLDTIFIDNLNWSDPYEISKALSSFDIGLYPILNNQFNLHKCGFKALEYMAMKIPVIVSPVGANEYIVHDNVEGYHAKDTQEWIEKMSELISNVDRREKMGAAGRIEVERHYNIALTSRKLATIIMEL